MAIVQCPECEEKISTEAKKCIHCGCEFSVCKECGAVLVGKQSVCPECGYVFEVSTDAPKKDNSNAKQNNDGNNSKKANGSKSEGSKKHLSSLKEIRKQWENYDTKQYLKTLRIVKMIVSLLCIGVVVWQFMTVDEWLFSVNKRITLITVVIALIGVMEVCYYAVVHLSDFLSISKMPLWAESKKLDLNTPMVEFMQKKKAKGGKKGASDETNVTGFLVNVVKAVAFKETPSIKSRFLGFRIGEIIIKAISSGFIWGFIILNVRDIAQMCWLSGLKTFFTEMFEFSIIEYWWVLIVGVAVLLLKFFYNIITETAEESCIDKWFNDKYKAYSENEDN